MTLTQTLLGNLGSRLFAKQEPERFSQSVDLGGRKTISLETYGVDASWSGWNSVRQ
jgi:hypothetical protein